MQVLRAVTEFERDLLIERTHQGLTRAKAENKTLGHPEATDPTVSMQRVKASDMTQAQVAAELGIGILGSSVNGTRSDRSSLNISPPR